MADLDALDANPAAFLYDEVEKARAVMLGNPAPTRTLQPMAPNVDRADGSIWFFTKTDTDLVKGLDGGSAEVACVLVSRHLDVFASIDGMLRENKRDDRIEAFWSPVAAAWYEKGRDDPKLTLLEYRPSSAVVWGSTGDPLAFAWEIFQANRKETTPDVGRRVEVDLRG